MPHSAFGETSRCKGYPTSKLELHHSDSLNENQNYFGQDSLRALSGLETNIELAIHAFRKDEHL